MQVFGIAESCRDGSQQVAAEADRASVGGDPREFSRYAGGVGASSRIWSTPGGKARFLVAEGTDSTGGKADGSLLLTTIRSHDQYNTTIYGDNDRYRGIIGRRDVVFVNADDLADIGLTHGDLVDVVAAPGRILTKQVAVAHEIARGSVAAYFPEANHLIQLEDHDRMSGTPAYKSVVVSLRRAAKSVTQVE